MSVTYHGGDSVLVKDKEFYTILEITMNQLYVRVCDVHGETSVIQGRIDSTWFYLIQGKNRIY